MTDRILRELSIPELDAAIAENEEQLRIARFGAASASDVAALEMVRSRLQHEFRQRGL